MVKDAYKIPRIQDTLDCLQGAVWFTLFDLKSGYWQIELEDTSRALKAFTVGPPWALQVQTNAIWADECSGNIPALHGDLFG